MVVVVSRGSDDFKREIANYIGGSENNDEPGRLLEKNRRDIWDQRRDARRDNSVQDCLLPAVQKEEFPFQAVARNELQVRSIGYHQFSRDLSHAQRECNGNVARVPRILTR